MHYWQQSCRPLISGITIVAAQKMNGGVMTTYDCEPSLSDIDVSDFCVREFTILDSIVPPVINTRTLNYLEDYYAKQEPKIWEQTATLSTAIFTEEWFKDNVTLHPLVAGAIRSLLGKNFALPDFLSNHRIECPMPADIPGRSNHLWHRNELSGVNVPVWRRSILP